jgi:hypothetical protein
VVLIELFFAILGGFAALRQIPNRRQVAARVIPATIL